VVILHLGMEVMQILMRIEVKKNVLCISFFVTCKIFSLLFLVLMSFLIIILLCLSLSILNCRPLYFFLAFVY
jgi:hypothetical protein